MDFDLNISSDIDLLEGLFQIDMIVFLVIDLVGVNDFKYNIKLKRLGGVRYRLFRIVERILFDDLMIKEGMKDFEQLIIGSER